MKLASRLGSYAVLALFVFIAVFPISRILTISLRPSDQLLSRSLSVIPDGATLDTPTSASSSSTRRRRFPSACGR